MLKKLFLSLFWLFAISSSTFFFTKTVYASYGVSDCIINIYTNNNSSSSQQLLLFSDNSENRNETNFDYRIPFTVPLTFEFIAVVEDDDYECSDMELSFKYDIDNNTDAEIKNNIRLGSDCQATFNTSLSYQSYLSLSPNPRGIFFLLNYKYSSGEQGQICRLQFGIDKSNNDSAHRQGYARCDYPQNCDGSTEKVQMCHGTILPLSGTITTNQYFVANNSYNLPQSKANNPNETWLPNTVPFLSCSGTVGGTYPIYLRSGETACTACNDINACDTACINGCGMDSLSCQTLQAARNAGIDTCGNGVCEADELGVGSAYYCASDCNVSSSGVGYKSDSTLFSLCGQIPDQDLKNKCQCCVDSSGSNCTTPANGQIKDTEPGIWTSMGCIKANSKSMLKSFIGIGLSLAGGICFLLIIISGFMFSISRGDSKRVSDAKEMLTNAVIGLLFIIFSITILRFLGITILQIPEFGTGL